MSKFGGKMSGFDKLKAKLNGATPILEESMRQAMIKSTLKVHELAVKNVQQPSASDGSMYRYGPKRLVSPAKAGEAPNTDTGNLVKGILFEFDDTAKTGYVGTNVKYGPWLEFGTEQMSARPWLGPAFAAATVDIAKIIETEFNKSMKKAFGVPNDLLKGLSDIKKAGKKTTRAAKRVAKKGKKQAKKAKKAARKATKKVGRTARKVTRSTRKSIKAIRRALR